MVMVIHLMVMVMRSSPDARGPTPYIPAEVARPPRPGYDNPDAEQLRRLFLPRAKRCTTKPVTNQTPASTVVLVCSITSRFYITRLHTCNVAGPSGW
jgi:hypothetical protein